MRLPDQMTYGESYGPLSRIETVEEAKDYFAALVDRQMRVSNVDRAEAERIERSNIGYWTGYLDDESAARIKELFSVSHPIFG